MHPRRISKRREIGRKLAIGESGDNRFCDPIHLDLPAHAGDRIHLDVHLDVPARDRCPRCRCPRCRRGAGVLDDGKRLPAGDSLTQQIRVSVRTSLHRVQRPLADPGFLGGLLAGVLFWQFCRNRFRSAFLRFLRHRPKQLLFFHRQNPLVVVGYIAPAPLVFCQVASWKSAGSRFPSACISVTISSPLDAGRGLSSPARSMSMGRVMRIVTGVLSGARGESVKLKNGSFMMMMVEKNLHPVSKVKAFVFRSRGETPPPDLFHGGYCYPVLKPFPATRQRDWSKRSMRPS